MPRHTAWELLRSGSPTPLRDVERAASARELDPRDRGLLRRLVATEMRRRGTLRALARTLCARRPAPDLAAHVHLGLVQAFFLDRIPDHALVSETLRAVHDTLGPSKVRFMNAVLREALRLRQQGASGDPRRDVVGRPLHLARPVFHDPAQHPLLWAEDALSLPAPLYKRWQARHGEAAARALAVQALDEAPLSLRAVRESERDGLVDELRAGGVNARTGRHPALLLAPSEASERVLHGAAFLEGRLTVQGETAFRAAEALEPRAGERLLDLCAAPGGKTAVLAASGAAVVAADANAERLERARATLERLRLSANVALEVSDGTASLGAEPFDGVLVDAPCSNTGVLAARPEARWRFGPAQRRELGALQERLLEQGAALVRSGGRLVWSTCSLEPEENHQLVEAFAARSPGWSIEAELESLPDAATSQDEGAGPVDGGYWARLRRA
jgi:16S rRNA (cytosine967-C5)-methyltransferase